MGKDSLDQYIKDQVFLHKTPTDPELIWRRIQTQRNGNTFGKKRWLYLLIPIFFIGALTVFYFPISQHEADILTSESYQAVPSSNLDLINTPKNQSPKSETTLVSQTSLLTETQENHNEISKKEDVPTLIKAKNKAINETKSNQYNLDENETTRSNQSINEKKKTVPSKMHAGSQNATPINISSSEKSNINAQSEAVNMLPKILQLESLALLNPYSGLVNIDPKTFSVGEFIPPPPAPLLLGKKGPFGLSVGIYGKYGFSDKKLSTVDSVSTYLAQRESTESSLETVGFGVDLKISGKTNFYWKTGFDYEQINERFNLEDFRDTTYMSDNELIRIIIDMNGDSIKEFGKALVTETSIFQKRIHIYHRSVDIPIILGYEYRADNLGYFFEAGASVNLLFKQKGEILSPENSPYSLGNDPDNLFKSWAGLSIVGGFGLSFQISDRLEFYGQTMLKFPLGAINSASNPIEQKYVHFGLQSGIRYDLTW